MELLTKMKAMVTARKHLSPKKKEDPKEKDVKKYVHPNLLTAAVWSKDVLDMSLEKLDVGRSSEI